MIIKITCLLCFLPLLAGAQTNCELRLTGKVVDSTTGAPLPFANVYDKNTDQAAASDAAGTFVLRSLCAGKHTIICSFVGYTTYTIDIDLSGDLVLDFALLPEVTAIKEVVVEGERTDDKPLISQVKVDIKGQDLAKIRGATLGEALTSITGVYTLQSGPSIFKPVIHGLHSNRVLLFNNGVRQEGQQWGSEHAPEIDPFIATKLSVVKGASSIRYGSDAIGGVILVEPATLPSQSGISGEVNLIGATNNGMGVGSAIMQGGFDKKFQCLSWRVQGTYRRAGNSRTPDYYLDNTGLKELNFSGTLGYKREKIGGELYYSQFNTRLGIFTGTHASSIGDIQAAIQRDEPITPSHFSYTIGRPYQQVKHDLFKANAFVIFNNDSRLDLVFARQQNERSEYDYVPLNGKTNPELYLRLISHTLDAIYKHRPLGNYSGTLGFNGITQGNVRQYEMLIPNFRNYGGGLFYIGQWSKDNLTLEAGARYDYRWLRAYTLDNSTAKVITPTWDFRNWTGTIGSQYYIRPNVSWMINLGTAWRAPSVSELLSQGVHQSAIAYEIGNANLKSEIAYNISTSLHVHGERWHGELGLYDNTINGYIFLKPDLKYIHTVRGAYPTFTYTQVNARFRGIDLSATYNLTDSLSFTAKVSMIYAWNKTVKDYLQLIPANRFDNSVRLGIGDVGVFRSVYAGVGGIYTARQKRVPANSDYLVPPSGYFLLSVSIGFSIPMDQQRISISLVASNLLNMRYRDYMDRFRYFNDEPGRNFTLRVRVPFAFKHQQIQDHLKE